MFGRVARRYDLLNHLLSANLDRGWRRAAAGALPSGPLGPVLDLCGGTGDLTLAVARAREAPVVVCCDFAHPMLLRAARKFDRRGLASRCLPLEADALRLPFATGTFHALTVAFGVRNLVDMDAGLREMGRVLRPGGRLVVLEFSQPAGALSGPAYRLYLRHLLPRIGRRMSDDREAYRYLAGTIAGFPTAEQVAGRIRAAGFTDCAHRTRALGIVAIHTAVRGSAPAEQ
jgi:demethylmenaquinone methyltransferase/2-methoxy-6-polyprenyl-1,4-benzoquinol methylase